MRLNTAFLPLVAGLIHSTWLLSSSARATNVACTYPSSCWPSDAAWSSLNQTLQGNLIRARPVAAPCHDPYYDEALCSAVTANWTNNYFRADQPGGYVDLAWENGDEACYINQPRNATCQQGLVPIFVAAVRHVKDVQAAVKFAAQHKISTRVKGASHDYLGKSSGNGTFGIQTINLKGITFDDHFTPQGCYDSPQSSITVAAGEHWYDVNAAADAHGVVVVSGADRSVGAAGGWILGGGHSFLSPQYGLGVDNVLQFEVVTPDGQLRTANACQEKDLFWALSGGGAGFGVVTRVTYKAHPPIKQMVGILMNASYPTTAYKGFLQTYLAFQPTLARANFAGYSFPDVSSTAALLLIPNSGDLESANATLKPLWDYVSSIGGNIQARAEVFPSYFSLWSYVGASNASVSILGSRLVPSSFFESPDKVDALAEAFSNQQKAGIIMHLVAGGKVSKVAGDATAVHPSWRRALHHIVLTAGWDSGTPLPVQNTIKQYLTNQTQIMANLVPGFGAYINEADRNEPRWSDTFWGSNYPRLLSIKKKIDPDGILTCSKCVGDSS